MNNSNAFLATKTLYRFRQCHLVSALEILRVVHGLQKEPSAEVVDKIHANSIQDPLIAVCNLNFVNSRCIVPFFGLRL